VTIQIKIVDQNNRHHFTDALHDMHRMRYRAAVQEMGWCIPGIADGYDRDAFDYPDTVYILYFNADGSVGACARLNPTTRPHLLSDVFSDICEDGVPKSSSIYHYSRYLIERRGKTQMEFMRAWMFISQAVNEWCVANNVRQVSWLAVERMYKTGITLWKTVPLGLPKFYEDDQKTYIAALSTMDAESLRKVQRYTRTESPIADRFAPMVSDIRMSVSA